MSTLVATPLPRRQALRRRLGHLGPVGTVALVVIVVIAVVALLGPLIAPYDPDAIDIANAYAGSTPDHLLGSDATGRDTLSRLIIGARASLLGPLFVTAIAMVVATGLALMSAWNGGRVDTLISRALDVLFAFPGILFAVLAVALFGRGLQAPVIALGIAYTPYFARVTRSALLRERAQPYVAACVVSGMSATRICLRHLLPNVGPLVIAQATLVFGYAMVDIAAISYLGFGVQPPSADWGSMVQEGQAGIIAGHPQTSIYAGIAIVVAVAAINVLGERLAVEERRP